MSWDSLKVPLMAEWKAWWLQQHPSEIGEYSWEYLFERGKQIRPRLFCELWLYLCPDRIPCIELAFVIECIHVTTLILDDCPWMDNAEQRRGWPTLHTKFSAKKAFLVAHDIIHMAYLIFTKHPLTYYAKDMTDARLETFIKQKGYRLWKGQLMDLQGTGSLFEVASMKTGVLFEWVTETVAICIGLDPDFWKTWGNHLGILFQWVDDWNDREEDVCIGQRNAFNEDHEGTLLLYQQIWEHVSRSIGSSWFEGSFGIYMRSYFTDYIPLSSSSVSSSVSSVSSSISLLLFSSFSQTQTQTQTLIKEPSLKNTANCPKGIYFMKQIQPFFSHKTDTSPDEYFLKTDLWSLPEIQWRDHPEIQQWIIRYPWMDTLWTWLDTSD